MPSCYRLFRRKYSAIDATGAFLAGGRWNRKGMPMLYTSSTLSLACLEILVHVKEPRLPADYAWARFDLDEEFIATLPVININDATACTEIGTDWLKSGSRPAARAPSVIIPIESNILLNPRHPGFELVSVSEPTAFSFDPRLLKLGPLPL